MRLSKVLKAVVLLGVLLMASLGMVRAGGEGQGVDFDVIGSPSVDCTGQASITVQMFGFSESVGTELQIDSDFYTSSPESVEVSEGNQQEFSFSFPEQSGTVAFVFWGRDYSNEAPPELLTTVTVNCDSGESEEEATDDRFCFEPGEARAAIYGFKDGENYGIEIWAIDENSNGQRVIRMTASEIDDKTIEGERTLLNSSIFSSVKLYRLEDGRFQINVGPAGERKMHVCIFNAIPPTDIEKYTLSY